MSGQLTVGNIQLNDSATATNNFWIQEDNAGGLKLYRGNVGTTTTPILSVDSIGNTTLLHTASVTPMFSAYQSTLQSLSVGYNKISFQTEEFDTTNAYDSTSTYRFTPQVAGYYQVSGSVGYATGTLEVVVCLYKNGSNIKRGNDNIGFTSILSTLVYLNGTTDYLELYGYSSGVQNSAANSTTTYFQAALIARA
jgi:hypothetical protein